MPVSFTTEPSYLPDAPFINRLYGESSFTNIVVGGKIRFTGPNSALGAGVSDFKIGDAVTVGGPGTCAFMPRDVPHAWKNTGSETGRVLFLYTPAAAGGLIEALSERRPADEDEHKKLFERHRWEVIGPNPL